MTTTHIRASKSRTLCGLHGGDDVPCILGIQPGAAATCAACREEYGFSGTSSEPTRGPTDDELSRIKAAFAAAPHEPMLKHIESVLGPCFEKFVNDETRDSCVFCAVQKAPDADGVHVLVEILA